MKDFRRLCFAVVMIAAFTAPGLAGDIQTPTFSRPGSTQTPPGKTHCAPEASTAPGDMGNPGFAVILWLIEALR